MERTLHFIVFFAFLFSVFGFMQWYILGSYFRWLYRVASEHAFYRYRAAGLFVFAVANIVFVLRFPSTELGWYQNPLFQSLIIYPGGVFFGVVVFTFLALLVVNSGAGVWKFGRRAVNTVMTASIASWTSRIISSLINSSTKTEAEKRDEEILNHAEQADRQSEQSLSGTVRGSGLINRRQFLRASGSVMIGAPVVFTIGATAATSHDYQVIRKTLHYPDLPSGLDGLRIVQLSDIHSGIYMTETQMRDIFHLANEQQPDLVVITGDFVDNSISEIPALYRAVPELKSEYGIYGCLGNHDHYASAKSVTSALEQRNVHVLTNTHETLAINGERLSLIGVDDIQSGTSNRQRMSRALRNMPDESFRILLSHRPDLFDHAMDHNIDLTFAGHTHGGQIGFDVLGVPVYPIHLFHDYAKGLYDKGRHKLYVNVGIGMVGIPVRMVRPELTVLQLSKSAP